MAVPFESDPTVHILDYGIDAPGVRWGMVVTGTSSAVLCGLSAAVAMHDYGAVTGIATVVAHVAAFSALYAFGLAGYMTFWSRIGKLRARDRLLDLANSVMRWTGNEKVLDVGCGHGLMLIGMAKRLNTGMAVGIDLWRNADQADNTSAGVYENARCEGVTERVSLVTGNAVALPFADGCFDRVCSHWLVHNLPDTEDRARAIDEMLRVLRPGGVLVLADIAHYTDYRAQLAARGITNLRDDTGGAGVLIIGLLSGGLFRPQAIVAQRP